MSKNVVGINSNALFSYIYLCVMSTGPLCIKPGSLLTLGCFFLGAATTTAVCVCTVLSTPSSSFAATACFTSVATGGSNDNSASCHVIAQAIQTGLSLDNSGSQHQQTVLSQLHLL
jgi:hypothetical protein